MTAFSGFYLALMIVLWLLIRRGVAIDFARIRITLCGVNSGTPCSSASILLAVVFGATLGNLIRGVPLRLLPPRSPLFTNFLPGRRAGILDGTQRSSGSGARRPGGAWARLTWFWKQRAGPSRPGALPTLGRLVGMDPTRWNSWPGPRDRICSYAIIRQSDRSSLVVRLRDSLSGRIRGRPGFSQDGPRAPGIPVVVHVSSRTYRNSHDRELSQFVGSTIDPSFSLTAANTASAGYGLRAALLWWFVGITLVGGYFVNLFRSLRGKVPALSSEGEELK